MEDSKAPMLDEAGLCGSGRFYDDDAKTGFQLTLSLCRNLL